MQDPLTLESFLLTDWARTYTPSTRADFKAWAETRSFCLYSYAWWQHLFNRFLQERA